MNSYQNVLNGNEINKNTLLEKGKNLTLTEMIVIAFFSVYAMFPSNQAVLYIGFGLMFISVFFNAVLKSSSGTIQIPPMSARVFMFLAYSLLSFLWAIDSSLVMHYAVITILSALLTIVLVAYILQREKEDVVFYAMALLGISLAIYIIVSYGGFSGFYNAATEENARLGGDVSNVNNIGMQCAYSAMVIFAYALFFKKRICYVLFLIPSVVAVSSGSRKAVLMLIIGVIFLVYYKQQEDKTIAKYIKYLVVAMLLITIFIYIMQLPIMETFLNRFEKMMNFYSEGGKADESTKIRNEMLVVGFKQFMFKPFMGIGLGNSTILNQVKLNHATYSHNDYIELLVNGGIVGFVIYYSIYISLIRSYLKIMKTDNDPKLRIAFVLLINFLIANWGCVTYYGSLSTYLYLALWIGQIELKKRKMRALDN